MKTYKFTIEVIIEATDADEAEAILDRAADWHIERLDKRTNLYLYDISSPSEVELS